MTIPTRRQQNAIVRVCWLAAQVPGGKRAANELLRATHANVRIATITRSRKPA